MKTVVSLPNDLFGDAERYAKQAGKSRNQLYAEALVEYLARHAPDEVTERMTAVVDEIGESVHDSFVTYSACRRLANVEW